ncbi:unnamed protein product [Amoebophrya sp. A120]|nr:unnamed protein product [Amoebophrya sp. A120]|eukprot:GSA120T00012425001.1
MLDLMTLGFSMGLQSEMQNIRKESECGNVFDSSVEEAETTTVFSTAASAVESALHSVENAASVVLSALTPSAEQVDQVMSCFTTTTVPQLDLTLPLKPKKM